MADPHVVFDEAALDELFASPNGPTGKMLARKMTTVARFAKRMTPVDTGRARSSIAGEMGADPQGLVARVGSDVEYFPYIELGTTRMYARAPLRQALAAVMSGGTTDPLGKDIRRIQRAQKVDE